jgi:acyl-CoA synthetase (AMP-forming)/AMP-acid ligase II
VSDPSEAPSDIRPVAPPRTFALADVWEMAADAVPDRVGLVVGDRRLTYAAIEDRANRLANHLTAAGIGRGDHVAVYLENCTEYLETMLACFKLRAVPINVNYRYVADELRYLLADSDSVAVVRPPKYAERLHGVLGDLPKVRHVLESGDEYEAALSAASAARPHVERSDDDLYIIYTGGTTGMPKGVMWRQGDAFFTCFGGGDLMRLHGEVTSPSELPARISTHQFCYMPLAPMMHAAAQWTSLANLFQGGKVVLIPGSLDCHAAWRAVEEERVNTLTVVGDAVARPMLDAWDEAGGYDASSLFSFSNGGAPLSPALRARVAATLPDVIIADGFGSSETGARGASRQAAAEVAGDARPARFTPYEGVSLVVDDDNQPIAPGSDQVGRLIARGRLPLGYYNDPDKTAATFIDVAGDRWAITGDMARVLADGTVELLGRGSGCINTGGEKVFPEEVEAVLRAHPSVYDVLVVGVPDERWGTAVTAVVQPVVGHDLAPEDIVAHCKASLAGYKAPKHVVLVDGIERSPAGKADYRWARDAAIAAIGA